MGSIDRSYRGEPMRRQIDQGDEGLPQDQIIAVEGEIAENESEKLCFVRMAFSSRRVVHNDGSYTRGWQVSGRHPVPTNRRIVTRPCTGP